MRMYFLLLISGAVAFEVIADALFRSWSLDGKSAFFWIGIGFYTVGTFIWAYSLKFDLLSKAISVFTITNLIAVVLVGLLYFKENLSMPNKIGIVLGVLSVILLQL